VRSSKLMFISLDSVLTCPAVDPLHPAVKRMQVAADLGGSRFWPVPVRCPLNHVHLKNSVRQTGPAGGVFAMNAMVVGDPHDAESRRCTCFVCAKHRELGSVVAIYRDDLVYVGHAMPQEGATEAYLVSHSPRRARRPQ
jgi:hypothetical protein